MDGPQTRAGLHVIRTLVPQADETRLLRMLRGCVGDDLQPAGLRQLLTAPTAHVNRDRSTPEADAAVPETALDPLRADGGGSR
jgi:hypothetical protein